ncbi:hypothetical protein R3P38DRAFT_2816328 [Favolaschia claudopus]|uniref:Uncharacterized protein n=1 Tax=Favolaschia claudopus TaxID=2862362 RepID=A0AAV9YZ94_9AGAR
MARVRRDTGQKFGSTEYSPSSVSLLVYLTPSICLWHRVIGSPSPNIPSKCPHCPERRGWFALVSPFRIRPYGSRHRVMWVLYAVAVMSLSPAFHRTELVALLSLEVYFRRLNPNPCMGPVKWPEQVKYKSIVKFTGFAGHSATDSRWSDALYRKPISPPTPLLTRGATSHIIRDGRYPRRLQHMAGGSFASSSPPRQAGFYSGRCRARAWEGHARLGKVWMTGVWYGSRCAVDSGYGSGVEGRGSAQYV